MADSNAALNPDKQEGPDLHKHGDMSRCVKENTDSLNTEGIRL